MKKLILPLLLIMLMLSAACGAQNDSVTPSPGTTPTPSSTAADDGVHQETVVWPTGTYIPVFGENIATSFELTSAQQQLYDTYVKDFNFDTAVLADAAPVDIAAVFVECGINGLWEGEYNLFCFNDKPVTRAAYKEENDADLKTLDLRSRRDMASLVFPFINEGTFVDNGDDTGYIDAVTLDPGNVESGVRIGMSVNMTRVDGIWKVNQFGMVSYDYDKTVEPLTPDSASTESARSEESNAAAESAEISSGT
jgi:hypothetical protein